MSKPRRQHFLPKTVLKPFSDQDNDKFFVEIGNVNTGDVKYPISIADICVSKNLYTLPYADDSQKYMVEKMYAEEVDSVYPEVLSLLTDPNVDYITDEQRHKILNVIISLYFRNDRFLRAQNDEIDEMMDRMADKPFATEEAQMFMRYGGRSYSFKRKELEEVRARVKLDNRLAFIVNHLADWQQFVKMKDKSQIAVSKIVGDVKLITGDNPVRIYNDQGDTDDIFDTRNAIQFPLDQEHLLWISPNSDDWERNRIYRQVREKWFAIAANHSVAKYASEWVISKKDAIQKFFAEMPDYDAMTPENEAQLENIKTLATELEKFLEFVESNGGPFSPPSKKRLLELKENPVFANDPQFQIFYKEIIG
jgi:hypothetical protein